MANIEREEMFQDTKFNFYVAILRVNIVIENRGVCHPSLHTQRVFA